MSSTNAIREEIFNSIKRNDKEGEIYLSALIMAGGELSLPYENLTFSTVHPEIAQDYCLLVKEAVGESPTLAIITPFDKRKKKVYSADLPSKLTKELVKKLGIMCFNGDDTYKDYCPIVPKKVNKGGIYLAQYLKGLFLLGGSVFLYESGCSAKLNLPTWNTATTVFNLLTEVGLQARLIAKNEEYFIVIKAKNSVLDFLALLGANQVYYKWTDKFIVSSMNNEVNRQANCEAANADREAQAAVKQAQDIQTIIDAGKLPTLDEGLRDLISYRIENPSESLENMANALGLSKSGIYHRLKRIAAVADDIRSNI